MDWTVAIDRNREALLRIVMVLFAAAGIVRGGVVEVLPRGVRSMILRTLRAGEAACRRLIVVQARGMEAAAHVKRAAPERPIPRGEGDPTRLPSFPLFDARKRFAERRQTNRHLRISSIGYIDPVFPEPAPELTPDDPLDARRVCLRLEALARALEDLPKQAKRLIRAEAQRQHAPPGPRRAGPLRPGWPPGYRQRHTHPVDEVLYHCHVFARRALDPPRKPTNSAAA